MNFLEILLIVFGALWILSICLYIPKFVSWSYGFKKTPRLKNDKKSRIAIIIPAKDEADCIEPLFDSINKQTYDAEYFDTFLVEDNIDTSQDDETIKLAKQKLKNFEYILEEPQNGKGHALKNIFEYILKKYPNKYDAYIIVDADNILTPTFVEEMNNALASGADIIIGKKLIKNWESKNKENHNLIANISALTYTGIDTLGNKYKNKKGYSLTICGQGLMLTKNFINKFGGFPFTSLTEDIEINIEAILNDFKQYYYEYAQIYSEEPITHKEFNKRRYRWLKGFFTNTKKYRKQLMDKTFRQGKIVKENLNFMFELYPVVFMFVTSAVASVTFLISAIVLTCIGSGLMCLAWWLTFAWLMVIYLMVVVFNIVLVTVDKDNKMTFGEKLAVIFLGPFITIEYAVVFLKVLNKNYKVDWLHIKRIKV